MAQGWEAPFLHDRVDTGRLHRAQAGHRSIRTRSNPDEGLHRRHDQRGRAGSHWAGLAGQGGRAWALLRVR
ncbi:hypothetical protein G6F66_015026 [Rhizopus arrhizus]|nr:hypothetical protein G6F68_021302 [Rhizopus microsporus]KAG1254430.1 hypothetical protein G6F66_015026 [Rhizopus arrhizus]